MTRLLDDKQTAYSYIVALVLRWAWIRTSPSTYHRNNHIWTSLWAYVFPSICVCAFGQHHHLKRTWMKRETAALRPRLVWVLSLHLQLGSLHPLLPLPFISRIAGLPRQQSTCRLVLLPIFSLEISAKSRRKTGNRSSQNGEELMVCFKSNVHLFLTTRNAGDIVYVQIFGTSLIILNTREAARELLEKRSLNYSCRPRFVLLEELYIFPPKCVSNLSLRRMNTI